MSSAEISRVIVKTDASLSTLVERAKNLLIGEPRVYSAADIIEVQGCRALPVELAGEDFQFPILSPIPGVEFAWLDPSGRVEDGADPRLKLACAVETGVRLEGKMTETKKAIVVEAPSGKSTDMSDLAAQIAANISGGEVLVVKAGGGVVDNEDLEQDELKNFFPEEVCSELRSIQLEVGQKTEPKKLTMLNGESVYLVRYKPVTGKNKFMFLTATQYAQMGIALQAGAVLTTIEDVVTLGTTINVEKDLLTVGEITEELAVIAAAKEGDKYQGPVDFAIQIPILD